MDVRSWAVALLVLASSCGGSSSAVPAPKSKPVAKAPADVARAVTGVLEQYRQAYEVRSFPALELLWDHGVDAALTHQGNTRRGWQQVRPYLSALLRNNSDIRMTFSRVRITALGDGGAAVTASLERKVGDGVTMVEESGTINLALRQHKGSWVIVTEHFSYSRR